VEEWAARLVRMLGVRKVRVTGTFPHGIAVRLVGAGVRVRLMRGPAVEDRSIKTAAELAKIRDAQQAAVIAMRVAVRTIAAAAIGRDGALRSGGSVLTSERVRRLIAQVLLEHDCWCRDTIVACGAQSVDPHEVGSGPLRAREPIVIDIFPQHMEHGYWGDLTRTVLRGEAPAGVRQAYLAVRAGQNAALARIRPGVACRSVHREAVAAMQGRGFRTGKEHGRPVGFIHGTGHGVGLEVHEAPALGLGEGRLRRGHVVTVEPGLYYPGIGGIRIEDTVVVTRSGWSYLVPCEKRLEV
jgi:Xaa-Pro aminopeptidase